MDWQPLARRLLHALPLLALCLPTQARAVDEGELKAAIVFNILLFVDWPAQALPEPGGVLALCVGPGSALKSALKALHGRPIRAFQLAVRDLPPAATVAESAATAAPECHAVFVDAADRAHMAASVRAQRAGGALMVSDDVDAPRDATAIVLQRMGNRIAFDVNLQPVRQAGLQLSSKLLRLARVVRE